MLYPHLFGPIQSRRLGRSLGVDMTPRKTCNLNCVYCECGGEIPNNERKEYIAASVITGELQQYLAGTTAIDYVTFAGSGEPTLNTALGTTIRFVKSTFPHCKCALLTNSTTLHLPEVREAIMPCDLVLPSLDAISDAVFARINRPHPTLRNSQIIEGLTTFAQTFPGQIWVEVFIVPGINDTPEELGLLKTHLLAINPARVQLNSLDRPGTCAWVVPAEREHLTSIAAFFAPLNVEIIARTAKTTANNAPPPPNITDTIIHQLQRRPATRKEIAQLCGISVAMIEKPLQELVAAQLISTETVQDQIFYTVAPAVPS